MRTRDASTRVRRQYIERLSREPPVNRPAARARVNAPPVVWSNVAAAVGVEGRLFIGKHRQHRAFSRRPRGAVTNSTFIRSSGCSQREIVQCGGWGKFAAGLELLIPVST